MASFFQHDLASEQMLQPFLDRCYGSYGIQAVRSTGLAEQLKGIDVRLSKGNVTLLVDEKAQLHYIGKCLNTFALEIDYLKHGELRPGWLFNEDKDTEVYAFVFDIEVGKCGEDATSLKVVSANTVLVNRARLINGLAAAGLERHILERVAKELRTTRTLKRTVCAPGVLVLCSHKLDEQPVNLLVTRKYLEHIGQKLMASGQ